LDPGREEILYALLPFFGLAAFTLVLPMTLLVLFGVMLVVLSYREVVSVYTRAGGSYVVARENFGPRVAQIAAVASLIDYVVTVAVQTAAGSAAIVSAFPALSRVPIVGPKILLVISVLAGSAARHRPDRVAAPARPGDRAGPAARGAGPARPQQQRAGLRGSRLHRRPDRRLLRPHPDRGPRAGPPGPPARHGRHRRRRPPRDDQPGL
jgi:hypothetical protein